MAKVGKILDRLALASKLLVFVLGTKDKTALNKIADGLQKAKEVKDVLEGSPDETLKERRGDEGVVMIYLLVFVYCLGAVIFMAL